MYSYEQKMKAVELYIEYDHYAAAVRYELGYPKRNGTLLEWYREYMETGDLHEGYKPYIRKYTEEEREAAVRYFLENGRSYANTITQLGYPSYCYLRKWVKADVPEEERQRVPKVPRKPAVTLSPEEKRQVVIEYCSGCESAAKVGKRHGVSASAIYTWKEQMLEIGLPERTDNQSGNKREETPERRIKYKKPKEFGVQSVKLSEDSLTEEYTYLQQEVNRLRLEKEILEAAVDIIKKEKGVSLDLLTNQEKAMLVDTLKDRHPVTELTSISEMARSTYYYQEGSMNAPDKYEELRESIYSDYCDSYGTYGYRRIHQVMKNRGEIVSEKVVRRIMKEEHIANPTRHGRGHHISPYHSYKGEISPAVPNLLKHDFHAEKPNEKWVTDITEFAIPAGKVYLSPMLDCLDGMPVSWVIGTSPNAKMAYSTLDAAIATLREGEHPIVHTDRGGHYRRLGWINRMDSAGLTRSMSRKGNCSDNAACEGFFGRIKNEMFYGRTWWRKVSLEEFIERLSAYLRWYVEERISMKNGGMSLMENRQKRGYAA